MRQYEVTERQLPEYGKVFTEHPKFGHYQGYIMWVCLVTGENQSKYFALSNLREVESAAQAVERPRIEHIIPDTDWPIAEYVAKPVPVLYVTADELGAEGIGGKNGRPAVPGVIVNQSSGVSIRVIQKPSLWHEALKAS